MNPNTASTEVANEHELVMSAKSRFGCTTCRKRKIKCDESLPYCRKCTSTGRQCGGPQTARFVFVQRKKRRTAMSKQEPVTTLRNQRPLLTATASPGEARAWDYFLERAGPALAGELDSEFWTGLVPCLSRANPTIRRALLAISCLHESPLLPDWEPQTCRTATQQMALKWYATSLSDLRLNMCEPTGQEDFITALLSCVLFTNIEFQQHNALNACNLLTHGYALIDAAKSKGEIKSSSAASYVGVLEHVLMRQSVMAACVGYYPCSNWCDSLTSSALSQTEFTCLDEARSTLFACLNHGMPLIRDAREMVISRGECEEVSIVLRQTITLVFLSTWQQAFKDFIASQNITTPQQKVLVAILLIYHEVASVWTTLCTETEETAADSFFGRFEKIVQLATEIRHLHETTNLPPASYSFEMGTIAPLFFTGWKCRHPILRRKALHLLMHGPPAQEALFHTHLQAKAVQKIIEIEEAARVSRAAITQPLDGTSQLCWLPSEEDRLHDVTVLFENAAGTKVKPKLIYYKSVCDKEDTRVLRQEECPF